MTSNAFTFDVADASFCLFEQLGVDRALADAPAFADFDREVYQATIEQAAKFAAEVLDPINRAGDREGCRFHGDGRVSTPSGYVDAWRRFAAAGWAGPCAPAEVGGGGLPHAIGGALSDIFSGAAMAFNMYPLLGNGAANVIWGHAAEPLRTTVASRLFSGQWCGTMCLTEAGAGSAVGDNKTRALPSDEPGVYLLEGEKIFISGGDHDLTDNIVHLVLARTPGSPSGTKGLSLFLAPKFWFDPASGALGARNGARVLRIEEKMGIHGSGTCVLGLGQAGPCKAWMIGPEHAGIAIMFEMMNEARIGVGLQGVATATAAYRYALGYARERIQGTAITAGKDPDAPRVPIIEHPDVRRMLLTMKVISEALRALGYRINLEFDLSRHAADEQARARHARRVDLLTPILKATATDLGFEVACLAVQVYGGYGYIGEYPVEQLVRDAKIQSIYEGTNGIQALDLIGRKLRLEGGRLVTEWLADAQAALARAKAAGLADGAAALGAALGQAVEAVQGLGAAAKGPAFAASVAVPLLRALGWVVLGLELLEQAAVVAERPELAGSPLGRGKLRGLGFFCAHLLPQVGAQLEAVRSGDESCLAADALPG